MRIAFLTSSVSRRGAGIAKAVEGLSGSLLARGHNVRVFALSDDAWAEDAADWQGAPVSVFETFGPASVGYTPRMREALINFAPDIAHLHGLWMHPARSIAQWAQRTSRPFVISPHGMLAPAALVYSPAKKRLSRLLYQDRSLRTAAGFLATSAMEADDIRLFGLSQPIDIVPNGIELRDRPTNVASRRTILSLGRLHPVKGLGLLVDVWARLEPRYPDWELRIVGPGNNEGYASELRRQANALGLERLHIEGPVYQEEKFIRLAEGGIFVLPSQSENFGLTVVESLMMGTPVVASQGTPWADLLTHGCGAWVPAGVGAFADAIEALLKISDAERSAMGKAGRTWVREAFAWPAVAQKAEKAYNNRIG